VMIHDDKMFLSDISNHRVLIYNEFPTHSEQVFDVVIGQPDFETTTAGYTRSKMDTPRAIWFDGEYLWVNEFSDSDRVLGFKAAIESVPPAAPTELESVHTTNQQIDLRWQDNATNERGYIIKYKEKNTTEYSVWRYLSSNSQSCSITGLTGNGPYDFKVTAYNSYGESSPTVLTGIDEDALFPQEFSVLQNYPNPFNPHTTIHFEVPEPIQVKIQIYDILGRTVKILYADYCMPGRYNIGWSGKDRADQDVSSGLYFYTMKAGEFNETRKMLLLR